MDQDFQIIDGKVYTKPPEPVEIPRETIETWLAQATQNKENAIASKATNIEQQDETIALWTEKESAIQAVLDQLT